MTKEHRKASFAWKLGASFIILAGALMLAIVLGAKETTVQDVWRAIFTNDSGQQLDIIRELRLPRELGALVTGSALAAAGAIMQGMTRNPLADPGILGLSAGANAALAINVAILPTVNYYGLMLACFIGAGFGALLVFGIGASKKGGFSPFRIVLAGAAVTALLFAVAQGVGLIFKISQNVSLWTAGGLVGTTWKQLAVIVPFIAAGLLIALLLSKQLTVLSISEDVAVGLGQKTFAVKAILFVVIVLLTGASVALAGNLAFVGLLVPHIVRGITGSDYRFILPMSAVSGGAFMLFADTAARLINAPYETPVVAIMAIVGLPFFLFVVHKGGRAFT
ncbi:iron ABC transporter permease [Metabacillus sp. GX 13764]|uniref:FecCD family ABC transporter permease n=1 Tax=Metabacillus kandeliae TaxID=2900151 RepID=UPI001E57EA70|nr:iron ABC transporter permease [Metabacillus kandeliae]MCD7034356.1 iron ABC transporter permease [Metabacillus kandeliae]